MRNDKKTHEKTTMSIFYNYIYSSRPNFALEIQKERRKQSVPNAFHKEIIIIKTST